MRPSRSCTGSRTFPMILSVSAPTPSGGELWSVRMTADRQPPTPTIYEGAGGGEAFERGLNAFYDLVEADGELAPLFGGRVGEEHRRNVTTWWCEVMGGSPDYSAELGGYAHMLAK